MIPFIIFHISISLFIPYLVFLHLLHIPSFSLLILLQPFIIMTVTVCLINYSIIYGAEPGWG